MPLYEYECEQCGVRFEVIQRFSDQPIEACRTCGGPLHKLISAPAIHFKGTGWYITDYAKKKNGSGESAESSPSSSGSGTKADTKSETKGDTKSDTSSSSTSSTAASATSSSSDGAKKD